MGIFCFDSLFLARPDFSAKRFAFFLETLKQLQNEYQQLGGDLLVVDALPQDFFSGLFARCLDKQIPLPRLFSFCRDYEPFARERDEKILKICKEFGISAACERDHLLLEPEEIQGPGGPGSFYKVFSPFAKKWRSQFEKHEIIERIYAQQNWSSYEKQLRAGSLVDSEKTSHGSLY